jgi:hypothetical protein
VDPAHSSANAFFTPRGKGMWTVMVVADVESEDLDDLDDLEDWDDSESVSPFSFLERDFLSGRRLTSSCPYSSHFTIVFWGLLEPRFIVLKNNFSFSFCLCPLKETVDFFWSCRENEFHFFFWKKN